MPRRSLRLQLTLWLLAPLLLLLGLDAWLTYHRALQAANAAFDRTLFTSAKAMAEGIRMENGGIVVDIPYLSLEMFEANAEGKVYYRVAEEGGASLTGYDDLPLPAKSGQAYYRPAYYERDYRGNSIRLVALRQPVHDVATARTRVVWVLVGETPESRRELAREILRGALLQEIVLVALALGIVWTAVSRGLRPLQRLSEVVAGRAEDDLAPLREDEAAAGGLPAELKPLVEAINQYIAHIQRMLVARRRFFADAAHQLKTPLAVLQAQAELAVREADAAAKQQQLELMLGSVRNASKGVKQLLSMSRLEPDSGHAVSLGPVDLAAVARDAALDWAVVARGQGVDLGFEQAGQPAIAGQPELLQELVGNLVDNAIRYAGVGHSVTVRVADDASPVLQVADTGPGVPADERDKVFLRFYRVSGTQTEGSGLGLPIVREIARVHGATVELGDTPGGGLTVTVRFPAPSHGEAGPAAPA